MINSLRVLFALLFIYIVYTVVATSLESNLFEEWNYLAAIPWMRATLVDFYIMTAIVYLWVLYRESNLIVKLVLLVLFITTGSIATTGYVLYRLMKIKSTDSIEKVLLKEKKV